MHQHWTDLDRSVDLNAPTPFDRTAPGQTRSGAAANATRPIVPVNGGVRSVNVLMNLGDADYDGLQTRSAIAAARSVRVGQLHAVEGDQHHRAGRQRHRPERLQLAPRRGGARPERGRSAPSRRDHVSYQLPYNITAGTVTQLASARPFNATTGIDNNGDGANNDRPVVNGAVAGRYSFRGTPMYDMSLFVEGRVKLMQARAITLRIEGFNLFNHANILGRNGTYGDTTTPLATFGQANPGLANIDPGRMVQFQAKFSF